MIIGLSCPVHTELGSPSEPGSRQAELSPTAANRISLKTGMFSANDFMELPSDCRRKIVD
jgi:hypothetical protein